MRKCWTTVILCMSLMLSACGGQTEYSSGDTVDFTDALGREISVEKIPNG